MKLDLPYPVVLRGSVILECRECGAQSELVAGLQQFTRSLAIRLAKRRGLPHPKEIRFMRKSLGWSGKDFAAEVGVEPETVSRWENGHVEPNVAAIRVLKLCVLHNDEIHDYYDEREDPTAPMVFTQADDSTWEESDRYQQAVG